MVTSNPPLVDSSYRFGFKRTVDLAA